MKEHKKADNTLDCQLFYAIIYISCNNLLSQLPNHQIFKSSNFQIVFYSILPGYFPNAASRQSIALLIDSTFNT